MKWQGSLAVAPPAPYSSPEPALGWGTLSGSGSGAECPVAGGIRGGAGRERSSRGRRQGGRGFRPAGLTPEAP